MSEEVASKRVLVNVPPAVHSAWKGAAEEKGLSMSSLARALLETYLKKEGKW